MEETQFLSKRGGGGKGRGEEGGRGGEGGGKKGKEKSPVRVGQPKRITQYHRDA